MKQSKSKEGLLCDHFMGCDVSNESGERVSNDCGSVQCNQTVQNNSPTFVVSPNKISHSSNSTADIVLSRTVDTTPKRHEIPREEDVIVDIVMFIQTLHSKPFLREVEDELAWTRTYEPIFGSIYHFIARHPDIFLLTVNEEEDCYVSVLRYNEYSKSRGALMYTSGKVLHKRKKQAPPSASRTKGIVCSACVAERIDLVLLQRMYKRLDYTTTLCNGVLHVTNVTTTNYGTCNQQFSASDFRERFDLFVYSFGSFVWWGTDSQQIKTIHNDYLRHGASEAYATFTRPFPPVVIDSLFPIWGTYEVNTASLRKCEDANDAFENGNPTTSNFEGSLDCNTSTTADIQEKKRLSDHEEVFTSVESDREDLYTVRKNPFTKSSAFMEPTNTIIPYHTNFSSSVITSNDFLTSKKFQYSLFQDHYILQGEGVGYKQTIAHVIAQSALLDVLEDRISEELTEACSALPIELRDRGYATLSDTQLACIRGKASLYRLNLLGDEACFTAEPEFLWEHPWFTDLYKVLQFHFSISTRVTFLDGKLTAAQEILDTLAEDLTVKHERRLEWTIIVLITLEVILALVELALNYIFGSYR